ncbi:helix-turn-helix domain-containing protein, partial [Proteus mirabilis]
LSLLQQNKYTLSDIAERVGYQSEAAFSKAFKSVFNCRPGQWKKQQSKV